jgi:tetratricopeptide (TPR) repeat protein
MTGKSRIWFFSCILAFFLFSPAFLGAQTAPRPDALAEYRNGNYARAVSICRDELAADPANLDSYVVICWSLIALGRYEEARDYGIEALSLARYDIRIIEIMGEANYYLGQNEDALRYFQQYINLAPSGSRIDAVYYCIGEIYIRLGRFRHADIALSTAVHHRDSAQWWARLAYARENAGDLLQAVSAYEHALSLDGQLIDAVRGLERVRSALASLNR